MSFTKGVSFHHEANASSQPTINNNISISQSQIDGERSKVVINEPIVEAVVEQVDSVPNETEFLRKVLAIYISQPIHFSGKYIVIRPDELLDLIETLLPDKTVVITSNDIEDIGCCSFKDVPIKKVDSIWIEDKEAPNGAIGTGSQLKSNFKYVYSNLVALFNEYRISIKFVQC